MVKIFITHIEQLLKRKEKQQVQYIPHFRTLDGKSVIGQPITIMHIVPTYPISGSTAVHKFEELLDRYKNIFAEKKIKISAADASTFFYSRPGQNLIRNLVWHAEMPYLSASEQKRILPKQFITGPENKMLRLAQWQAGVPYQIYDYDEKTGKITATPETVAINYLLQEKKCAIDTETEDWKKKELDNRILTMDDEELKNFYSQLAEQTETSVHPEHLLHWQRKEYLRKIDKLVDSLRKEKVLSSQYITFRGNDTVLHTLDCIKDIPAFNIIIPGTEEKLSVNLVFAKDSREIGDRLSRIMHDDDPLFIFGTNHVNFDYKTLKNLTEGHFAPKFSANITPGFMQRWVIPGKFDIDTFAYSMQASWTFRNNLDTTFNYLLGKKEKKSMNYDELILKTQQARQGNREAALEVLYYAVQDAMKSYLLGDHILEEILCESKQYATPAYRICTTSKKTLVSDKIQHQSWNLFKTYRPFKISDAKAWEQFSIYDDFWNDFKRQMRMQNFRSKKGLFTAHIIFPTLYYKTLVPVIEKTAAETIKAMENTADPKKKIRLMEYINAELEWVLYCLKNEYQNSHKRGSMREANDFNFRKYFAISPDTGILMIDRYSEELMQRIKIFGDHAKNCEIINHSERFLVLEQNLLSKSIVQQLEEEKLAIELGTGKVLSDTSGRFIAIIDGQTISQGIDPEGKRNRCEYETFLIQGFLQRGLELNDPKAALEFADGQIKKFYHNEIPEESLKCTKTARMDHYKYSDRATQRSSREAVRQEVLKDEKYEYTRMQEELFGENGTIKRVVQMRFPITLNNNAMKKLFSGEASKEDLEKILNKFSV